MPENKWLNKSVFVTGCTGLLGSWLTEDLISRGANVTALIRDFIPGSRVYKENFIDRINVVSGNLEDYYVVERALNEYEIEIVFHLAAQTIVPIANNNPLSTFESNIRGTWTLLEACRRNSQIRKIIAASSDKAYGEQKALPYTEDMCLSGKNPYDVSKSCSDLITRMYYHHYGLPVCVTRCGNLFGGGDLNFNRIIPGTIRAVFYNERPIIRSNGKYVRDYFYVKDAAEAYIVLAEKMDDSSLMGEAFNLGNDMPKTVLEITDDILSLMKRTDLEPVILNEAKGEILEQYLSSEKARKKLGWEPGFSVRDGLAETIEWYKNYFTETGK
ncbi:MAG TPA: NAD-dependent epimerase/dehydratase family protein [Nitrospirae bacterium]|nr:NAD-dependent epimerase/dehydratase family protein [Nitrospirota bacterium]